MLKPEDLEIGDMLVAADWDQTYSALLNIEGVRNVRRCSKYLHYHYSRWNFTRSISLIEAEYRKFQKEKIYIITHINAPAMAFPSYVIEDYASSHTYCLDVIDALTMRYTYLNFFPQEEQKISQVTNNHTCTKGSTPLDGFWICKECGKNMEKV